MYVEQDGRQRLRPSVLPPMAIDLANDKIRAFEIVRNHIHIMKQLIEHKASSVEGRLQQLRCPSYTPEYSTSSYTSDKICFGGHVFPYHVISNISHLE